MIPETGWMIAAVLGPATQAAFIASTAERLNIVTVTTILPTYFRVVRPAHCDAFELVPTR